MYIIFIQLLTGLYVPSFLPFRKSYIPKIYEKTIIFITLYLGNKLKINKNIALYIKPKLK